MRPIISPTRKHLLSASMVYEKTLPNGKRVLKMHNKKYSAELIRRELEILKEIEEKRVREVAAREKRISNLKAESDKLWKLMAGIAERGRKLRPAQQEVLKKKIVRIEKKLDSTLRSESVFVENKEFDLKFGSDKRRHQIYNIFMSVRGNAELLEISKVVEAGFSKECIRLAGSENIKKL